MTLDQVMTQAELLPAFPQIVFRILDELADDSANVESLSDFIVSDPAVVARLLSAANSASVSHGQRVASVRQAVLMLGVARVRNIVTATAIIDRFSKLACFDSPHLWRHSVGVAVCAQQIAAHAGLNTEIAYTAGLLHDIGQLLLFAVDPNGYAEAMTLHQTQDIDISDAERKILGLEHAAVGGELARLWKLPQEVADAITDHHASDDTPPTTEMADAIHIAEVMSDALELGTETTSVQDVMARVPPLSELACARLGIEWHQFAKLFPLIEARFDSVRLSLWL